MFSCRVQRKLVRAQDANFTFVCKMPTRQMKKHKKRKQTFVVSIFLKKKIRKCFFFFFLLILNLNINYYYYFRKIITKTS